MQIISRDDAVKQGLKRFFTGKPCKNGHVAERYICTDTPCVECCRGRLRRAMQNPEMAEKKRARLRKFFRSRPPEYGRARAKIWRERNPELHRARNNKWRSDNWESLKPIYRLMARCRLARRRAATPPWANLEAIEAIYKKAASMTEATGIEYHVDHIIPLRGKNVCGLHVETNLQVIPARENLKKGNRYGIHGG